MAEHNDTIDFTLAPIQEKQFEEVFDWIEEEGWNLTLSKLKTVSEKFDGAVYVAVTEQGTVLGTVSIIPTRKGECVLGNLVVGKTFRGKGVGKRMLCEIQQLYHEWSVMLCSVAPSVGFYSKIGFHDVGQSHEIFCMQVDNTELESKVCQNNDVIIRTYSSDMFEEFCQYDTHYRGYNMRKYLSIMAEITHLLVACLKSSGKIVGYIAALQKRSTVFLDGLYADNDDIALLLYWNVLKCYPDRTEVKIQTIRPRLFLTTFGNILDVKSTTYPKMANGKITLSSIEKLYNVTDSDYSA